MDSGTIIVLALTVGFLMLLFAIGVRCLVVRTKPNNGKGKAKRNGSGNGNECINGRGVQFVPDEGSYPVIGYPEWNPVFANHHAWPGRHSPHLPHPLYSHYPPYQPGYEYSG